MIDLNAFDCLGTCAFYIKKKKDFNFMDPLIHIERLYSISQIFKYFRKLITFINDEKYKPLHIDNKIKFK